MVAKKISRSPKAPASSGTADVKTTAKPAARKRAAAPAAARRKSAAAPTNGKEAKAPVAAPVVTDDDIRLRAYFLSLEHRGQASDVDFWLIAERELRPRTTRQE